MKIEAIKLLRGSHADTGKTGVGCFMNIIAYLNGDTQITDQSECVCITVKRISIFLNDLADEQQRQRMLPLVLRAMGSRTDDKEEISRRLTLLVEFAEWQAWIVAKYANAGNASANHALTAAECATDTAVAAGFAAATTTAECATAAAHAARAAAASATDAANAASFAEYQNYKNETFDRGMILLDAMLPQAQEADAVVIGRTQKLIELAAV